MAKKIAFTVDSSCDVPKGFNEKYDITVFPITNLIGDDTYRDGVDISASELLEKIKEKGVMPKTSALPVIEYEEVFEKLLETYDEVIHLSISSYASSSFQNSEIASKKFNGRVYAIDTKLLSGGIGLLLNKMVKMRADGLSSEQIVKNAQELIGKIKLSFVVDTMEFLHKGGRCSSLAYAAAKVLKIHPEIIMVDGQLKSGSKYIGGITKCYNKYVEDLAAKYTDYDKSVCYLTYSPSDPEYISKIRAKVEELFDFEDIVEVEASGTITCHCGQNTVGVLFITK